MAAKILSSLVLALLAVELFGQEYEISLHSNGEEVTVVQLSVGDESAVAKVGDVVEHFDLKDRRWRHDETNHWVTLSQSEMWAKQSRDKSRSNTASIPDNIRAFVLWSLDPTFEVAATDTSLTLTSGQVDYKIVGEKVDGDLTNYFRYARLNAYKKAMTERKLPPFAELRVIDELERRKMMPKSMEIEMPGIPGAPSIKVVLAEKQPPTQADPDRDESADDPS